MWIETRTGSVVACALFIVIAFLTGPAFAQKTKPEAKKTEAAVVAAAKPENSEPSKPEDLQFKGMKYRLVGPFRGGRSLTAAGVPGDPTTYYFGATGGGVWKSTDGALTWTSIFNKEGTSAI